MKNKSKTNSVLDLNFYPLEHKVGQISFSSNEQEILSTLGLPDEREYYYYSPTQYAINIFYPTFALFLGFQDEIYQGVSFHLDDLILEGKQFSDLSRQEILDCIEDSHKQNHIDFVYFYSDEYGEEEYYEFDNLGLTLWFDDENVTNICIQSPDAWYK